MNAREKDSSAIRQHCIHDFHKTRAEQLMAEDTIVTLKLNQQQLELIDRTIARGVAPDRAALVRLALREYAAAHAASGDKEEKT
jgi:hypothetical protein